MPQVIEQSLFLFAKLNIAAHCIYIFDIVNASRLRPPHSINPCLSQRFCSFIFLASQDNFFFLGSSNLEPLSRCPDSLVESGDKMR